MRIAGFFTITRPVNSAVAGLAAIIAYLIETGTVIPAALLLFFIVALITAAGNVINDYFDAEIDAINRPDRPIPSGAVTPEPPRSFAVTLFLSGILVSFFTNVLCIGIAIINSSYPYCVRRKTQTHPALWQYHGGIPLGKYLFIWWSAERMNGFVHIIPIAAITFFAMLSRNW